jgi:hypothetical protein
MLMGRCFRIALAVGLVAAVGCVGLEVSTKRANAQASVAVVSTSQWFSSSAGIEHAVGQLVNNGPAPVGQVTVNLSFYSSSNVLVGTGTTDAAVASMYSGEKSPFEDDFSPPAGYDHFVVAGFTIAPVESPPNQNFTATVTSRTVDGSGNTDIAGAVTNDNTVTVNASVGTVFTFFNGAGTAVAVEGATVDLPILGGPFYLAPGQSVPFELTIGTSDPAFPAFSSYSILTQAPTSPPSVTPHFRLLPGAATDISVGANGSVWVVGTNGTGAGYGIWHWTGSGWAELGGSAVRIAVGPDGRPWVVNSLHRIYHWNGAAWISYPGAATDISVSANGSVWIVGTNSVPGGFGIWHWNGATWGDTPGGAVRISVAPDGTPWVINSLHQVLYLDVIYWFGGGGAGTDMSVGPDASLWVVGTNWTGAGYGIYYWGGFPGSWVGVSGSAAAIAVAPNGIPWISNSRNQIYAG